MAQLVTRPTSTVVLGLPDTVPYCTRYPARVPSVFAFHASVWADNAVEHINPSRAANEQTRRKEDVKGILEKTIALHEAGNPHALRVCGREMSPGLDFAWTCARCAHQCPQVH